MRTPHLSRPSHTLITTTTTTTTTPHHNSALEGSMAAGTAPSASMFEKRSRPDRTFAYTDMAGYESTEFMSYPLLQSSETYSPLPLPPHINLQRPSEPASPLTIASTLSHTSSPSPSPSRTQPTAEPSHDFLLFDESLQSGANIYPTKRFQGGHRRFGSGSSLASDPGVSHTSHPAGQYHGGTVFPVIAQQDSFANSAFGNNYLVQSQLVGNDQMLFDMGKQVPKAAAAASRQMLQPPIHFGGQSAMAVAQALMQHHGHSDDEDQVPGLSPASRPSGLTGSSSRPSVSSEGFRSPSSPSRTPDQTHDLPTQSATTPRIYASSTQLSPHTPNMSHMSDVQGMISDFPNLFQKAQREHSMAQASPSKSASGHHSAFRVSSPYHPQHDASHQEIYSARMPTAHEQRIKERNFAAAEMLRQQMENEAANNTTTPKTISPKDSLLEYHEADGQQEASKFFDGAHGGQAPVPTLGDIYSTSQFYTASGDNDTEASFGSMATSRRESSTGSLHRTPSNQMQYTQFSHLSTPQFPYGRSQIQSAGQRQNAESFGTMSVDQPVRPASGFGLVAKASKPAVAKANIGTYTCTFEGCGQRFTTSAKLQRHRRESHRHASTDGAIGSAMSPAAVAARNAQPGPHKCTRVNPSTGKPCNIVFSRPYDLTRHEDTIHNAGKEKVRCEICTDEKTFSRYDALVRHKRVKHGIVDRH